MRRNLFAEEIEVNPLYSKILVLESSPPHNTDQWNHHYPSSCAVTTLYIYSEANEKSRFIVALLVVIDPLVLLSVSLLMLRPREVTVLVQLYSLKIPSSVQFLIDTTCQRNAIQCQCSELGVDKMIPCKTVPQLVVFAVQIVSQQSASWATWTNTDIRMNISYQSLWDNYKINRSLLATGGINWIPALRVTITTHNEDVTVLLDYEPHDGDRFAHCKASIWHDLSWEEGNHVVSIF